MRKFILSLSAMMIVGISAQAEGYQHGWKVYEKPQAGATYGGYEANPYGAGGSKSYGAGGGKSYGAGGGNSYGAGGGNSYGAGGGNSYGAGGGKNPMNPWKVGE